MYEQVTAADKDRVSRDVTKFVDFSMKLLRGVTPNMFSFIQIILFLNISPLMPTILARINPALAFVTRNNNSRDNIDELASIVATTYDFYDYNYTLVSLLLARIHILYRRDILGIREEEKTIFHPRP